MTEPSLIHLPFDGQMLYDEGIERLNSLNLQIPGNRSFLVGGIDSEWGFRSLHWFDTETEMFQFIANYYVAIFSNGSEDEYEAMWTAVNEAAQGRLSREEAIARIKETTYCEIQIEWWGSREELVAGDNPFSEAVRAAWRSHASADLGTPLSASAVQPFLDYLASDHGC